MDSHLRDLLNRIEAASGPDRELDDAICRHFGKPYAPYSKSLDCALSLVNEMLPDEWPEFEVHARMIRSSREWWHFWEITVPSREFQGRSRHAPLALLQCLIRALIQKETADHA